ncbi:MAG TPA: glycosyltransferase family 4 protein, partial [Methanomicrobiales archaeon]|nr:glycosyltransferase family 4 protein [Methanomicrobiales archaeon]
IIHIVSIIATAESVFFQDLAGNGVPLHSGRGSRTESKERTVDDERPRNLPISMKIGFIYDAIYPYESGGVERRVWEVSRRLAARGHEVHVFGRCYWEGAKRIEKEGVILHGICPPRPPHEEGRRNVSEALYFGARILPPILAETFDVIDCQAFPYFPLFSARAQSLLKNTALVITWHEVWGDYWREYLGWRGIFGKWLESQAAGLQARFIAASPSIQWDLYDLGVKRKIEVVPSGIDYQHIQTVPPSPMASDVIFAGRLIPEKNVDVLLSALVLVREQLPQIHCLVIGDGPEKDDLEKLSTRLGLSGTVTFTGFLESQDTVIGAMKASKVFVFPSSQESFGIAVLEAMACGIPVITTDHPQNAARYFVNGRNGLLSPLSAEELADKIVMALGSSGGAKMACRETAQAYDWDAIVERLESLYKNIVSERFYQ